MGAANAKLASMRRRLSSFVALGSVVGETRDNQ